MHITVVPDDKFNIFIAQKLAQQIINKPDSAVCIATGTTTDLIWPEFVRLVKELDIDLSRVFFFNIDEYAGVSPDNPGSCYYRIKRDLYAPLGLGEEQFYVPGAPANDMEEGVIRFQCVLDRLDGIDLMLLTVGGNGHIAFNEPGTPFESALYPAKISQSTVEAKKDMFGGADKVPKYGITMGIRSIMQAKKILFVAKGNHKADIIKKSINGPVTPEVPASVLQLHPFTEVVLDKSASG